jgi:branched-chain amino acid transport system ATP-binding protein
MLNVENLNVHYGDLQVLWDVSFEVNDREIVALIGSNGAGKSTLLRAITGLLKPTSGYINYDGITLNNKRPHKIVALGISMVPEGRRLFPKMTVLENLEMGAFFKDARREKQKTLKLVYEIFPVLKERSQQLAESLSGGEQQMLAIGRALMAKNSFLLLDEMSLGLAPLLVENIFEIVVQINNAGITIFIVEQNVPMTLKVSNRAYVLESGHIVRQGDAKMLLNDPNIKEAYLGMSPV